MSGPNIWQAFNSCFNNSELLIINEKINEPSLYETWNLDIILSILTCS